MRQARSWTRQHASSWTRQHADLDTRHQHADLDNATHLPQLSWQTPVHGLLLLAPSCPVHCGKEDPRSSLAPWLICTNNVSCCLPPSSGLCLPGLGGRRSGTHVATALRAVSDQLFRGFPPVHDASEHTHARAHTHNDTHRERPRGEKGRMLQAARSRSVRQRAGGRAGTSDEPFACAACRVFARLSLHLLFALPAHARSRVQRPSRSAGA